MDNPSVYGNIYRDEFIAGANIRKFCGLLLSGLTVIGMALWLHFSTNLPSWLKFAQGLPLPMKEYQLKRLAVFMPASDRTGDGIISFNRCGQSGGLWGKGYRQGTQGQLSFLPEHHIDFIFAVFSEEFGFVGVITIQFFIIIFLLRGISIAMQARDLYGVLIASGIVTHAYISHSCQCRHEFWYYAGDSNTFAIY